MEEDGIELEEEGDDGDGVHGKSGKGLVEKELIENEDGEHQSGSNLGVRGKGLEGKGQATLVLSKQDERLQDDSVVKAGVLCISVKRSVYRWESWLSNNDCIRDVARLRNSADRVRKVAATDFAKCSKAFRERKAELLTMLNTSSGLILHFLKFKYTLN